MSEEAAKHIGSGLGWLGFWIFMGMMSLDMQSTTTTIMEGATAIFRDCPTHNGGESDG